MIKAMTWVVALAMATTVVASETQKSTARIPSLKSGKCSITLLDKDGIKPLAGATLSLQSAKGADQVLAATASDAGLCVLDIAEGRYVLSVNEKVLTLLDVSEEGQLAWCRIVMSDEPMLIGGQGEEGAGFTFMGLKGGAGVAAAAGTGLAGAAGVGVGGDYADWWDIDGVDDDNDDDDDKDDGEGDDPASP
ncbi:MAG: hypothetical protein HN341_09060 [Verrucomicrobia bacterium]|jgi:hypothetical protein|nr:hypothetical protein [Verrucomicrobiota bacterium]